MKASKAVCSALAVAAGFVALTQFTEPDQPPVSASASASAPSQEPYCYTGPLDDNSAAVHDFVPRQVPDWSPSRIMTSTSVAPPSASSALTLGDHLYGENPNQPPVSILDMYSDERYSDKDADSHESLTVEGDATAFGSWHTPVSSVELDSSLGGGVSGTDSSGVGQWYETPTPELSGAPSMLSRCSGFPPSAGISAASGSYTS